nr:hypothetical protein [bacterium]
MKKSTLILLKLFRFVVIVLLFSVVLFPSAIQAYERPPLDVKIFSVDKMDINTQMKVYVVIEAIKNVAGLNVVMKIPPTDWKFISGDLGWAGSIQGGSSVYFEMDVIPQVLNPELITGLLKIDGWRDSIWKMNLSRLDGNIPEALPLGVMPPDPKIIDRPTEESQLQDPSSREGLEFQLPGVDPKIGDLPQGKEGLIGASSTATIRVTGRYLFVDDNSNVLGMRHATVQIRDSQFGVDEVCGQGITDVNGNFDLTVSCGYLTDEPDIYPRLYFSSGAGEVNPSVGGTYRVDSHVTNNVTGGTVDYGPIVLSNSGGLTCGACQQYNSLVMAWQYMASTVETPPDVQVEWPDDICAPVSCYNGRIHIDNGATWREDTFMHEYGHHILNELAESPSPDYDNGICDFGGDEGHCRWAPESTEIAWTEGWPHFYSAVTTRYFSLDNNTNLEDHTYCVDSNCGTTCDDSVSSCLYEGREAQIEGFAGAILWDIFDSLSDDQHGDGDGQRDELATDFFTQWDVVRNYNPPGSADHPLSMHQFWNGMRDRHSTLINRVSEIYREHHIERPIPDLTVNSVTDPPVIGVLGSSFSSTANVGNIGDEMAMGTFRVLWHFYESATGDRTELLASNITNLGAGSSIDRTRTFFIPSGMATGNYLLGACVDPDLIVPESDETNNCTYAPSVMTIAEITVDSPNGGEVLYTGDSTDITWTASPELARVKIEITRNGGGSWSTISASTLNDGTYSWTVSGALTSAARIRVSSDTYSAINDRSDAVFTIDERRIELLAPNGGETLYVGETTEITWDAVGISSTVEIQIGRDCSIIGICTNPRTIGHVWAGHGTFSWTVSGPATPHARIYIISDLHPEIWDKSAGGFEIIERSITVTSPNGGEVWSTGDLQTITWDSIDAGSHVIIDLSRDGGSSWESISTNTVNDGSRFWAPTTPGTTEALIRITSAIYPAISDSSDSNFTMLERDLNVISPNGGETWTVGESQEIKWNSVNAGANVSISLSRLGGDDPVMLTASTPNDGSYMWNVTGPATSEAVIRIESLDFPFLRDSSNLDFTILEPSFYTLSVRKLGMGRGAITSAPIGINCGRDCSETYGKGEKIVLSMDLDDGSGFGGWGGHPDCSDGIVTMTADIECTASLYLIDTDRDNIPDDGDASGVVGDNPCTAGVTKDCDDNCVVTSNSDQSDIDKDSIGDLCDNCVEKANPDQRDTNEDEDDNLFLDGIQHYGNICDGDFDNNGIVEIRDFILWRPFAGQITNPINEDMDLNGNGAIWTDDFI